MLLDVRRHMTSTGSRCDHAHFRYDDPQIGTLVAFISGTSRVGAFKLGMGVGFRETMFGFKPPGCTLIRSGATSDRNLENRIFDTGHRPQFERYGSVILYSHRAWMGAAHGANRIPIPIQESEISGVKSALFAYFRVFEHLQGYISRIPEFDF